MQFSNCSSPNKLPSVSSSYLFPFLAALCEVLVVNPKGQIVNNTLKHTSCHPELQSSSNGKQLWGRLESNLSWETVIEPMRKPRLLCANENVDYAIVSSTCKTVFKFFYCTLWSAKSMTGSLARLEESCFVIRLWSKYLHVYEEK